MINIDLDKPTNHFVIYNSLLNDEINTNDNLIAKFSNNMNIGYKLYVPITHSVFSNLVSCALNTTDLYSYTPFTQSLLSPNSNYTLEIINTFTVSYTQSFTSSLTGTYSSVYDEYSSIIKTI